MKKVHPPLNVTPRGVISTHQLLEQLGRQRKGKFAPIAPSDVNALNQLKKGLIPQETAKAKLLLPTGKRDMPVSEQPKMPSREVELSKKMKISTFPISPRTPFVLKKRKCGLLQEMYNLSDKTFLGRPECPLSFINPKTHLLKQRPHFTLKN